MKRLMIITISLMALILFSGCSSDNEDTVLTIMSTDKQEIKYEKPKNYLDYTCAELKEEVLDFISWTEGVFWTNVMILKDCNVSSN